VTYTTSAQRKFFRGVEQVRQLLAEVEAFENRDAYVFGTEVESRSTHQITYRSFAVEREAPPEDWPLLAGDAIQNLRAALDHIVYTASGDEEQTKFPIFTDPAKFQQKAPGMLKGVPESVRATIEKAQPYRDYPPDPAQTMLVQLQDLSNLDKHRTLATIASAVVREGVGVREGVNIAWQRYGTGRSLGSGVTHVSTFTASAELELAAGDVQPMFSYEVRIEGRRVDVLKGIVHDIYPVLVEAETGEPLPIFAPYPL
jgi:hypothetical protein